MKKLSAKELSTISALSPQMLREIASHVPFSHLFISLADAVESDNQSEAIHSVLTENEELLKNLQNAELPSFDSSVLHKRISDIFSTQDYLKEEERELQKILEKETTLKSIWETSSAKQFSLLESGFADILHQLVDGISNPQAQDKLDLDTTLKQILEKQSESWNHIDVCLQKLIVFTQSKNRPELTVQIHFYRVLWHQNHLSADLDMIISLWQETFLASLATQDWSVIYQIGQNLKRIALLTDNHLVFTQTIEELVQQAKAHTDIQKEIFFLLEWALQKTLVMHQNEQIDDLIIRADVLFQDNYQTLPPFVGARVLLTTAQIQERRSYTEQAKQIYKKILRAYKNDAGCFSTYIRAALNLGRIDVMENRISLGSERIAFAYQGAKKIGDWHLFSSAIQACFDCAKEQNDLQTQEKLLQEGFVFATDKYNEEFAMQAVQYWKNLLNGTTP